MWHKFKHIISYMINAFVVPWRHPIFRYTATSRCVVSVRGSERTNAATVVIKVIKYSGYKKSGISWFCEGLLAPIINYSSWDDIINFSEHWQK